MGKLHRGKRQEGVQQKKGKKKQQFNKGNQSDDDQQVEDVMAWGRKRQNYYKQDEDEYSSQSQQQKQAAQIYNTKYDNYLNDEQAYDIPIQQQAQQGADDKKLTELEENLDEDEALPEQYITQELQWTIQLFKDLEEYEENELLRIYEKMLKSYLTVIISIKELKVPYIQYHPIIPMAVDIKTKITLLMKKLTLKEDDEESLSNLQVDKSKKITKTFEPQNEQEEQIEGQFDDEEDMEDQIDEDEEFEDQDFDDGEQWNQQSQQIVKKNSQKQKKSALQPYPDHCENASKVQKEEHKKGLEFYNEMKEALEQQKKQKKQQKREERKQNKKPAFKEVGQNEGRFASELILKNKGLIKKRKKIQGNSRLKLRKKYEKKKAIHRARSGHFIRENPGRAYEGESNIRTGKIAGVRLK